LGALLELVPGLAVLVVWIGSRPESLKYSDFAPLQIVALLPALGWLWRDIWVGFGLALGGWVVRLALITTAAFMWAGANDHQVIKIEDRPSGADIAYCCHEGFTIGMHAALGGAVALSALSAFGVATWELGEPRDPGDEAENGARDREALA
jgi:hypothetical protein